MAKKPRARFTSTGADECTLTYEDAITGETVTREFASHSPGSCVREESGAWHGTLAPQVCDGLAHRGFTLVWTGQRPLVDLIRREYRAMRRRESRQFA